MNIMWDRRDLKAAGKAAFKKNYWPCVLVALVLSILTAGATGYAGKGRLEQLSQQVSNISLNPAEMIGLLVGVAAGSLIVLVIAILIEMFIINPLKVGGVRFFVRNAEVKNPGVNMLFSAYSEGRFGSIFITMLLKDLFLMLWTMLFIIPGIIKFYSYRMVPYILAEHPEMSPTEVITVSRQMMRGQKWNAFVLDLSFILWYLLTAITAGLVGIFYVCPYVEATNAELYRVLRNQY